MKVAHRQLLEGARLSFADCFQMEYRISQGFAVRRCVCVHVCVKIVGLVTLLICVIHVDEHETACI